MKPIFKSKSEWTSTHMSFNPDLNQAQKNMLSWKMTKPFHSQICFNILLWFKESISSSLALVKGHLNRE